MQNRSVRHSNQEQSKGVIKLSKISVLGITPKIWRGKEIKLMNANCLILQDWSYINRITVK